MKFYNNKIKESRIYQLGRLIMGSAPFALLLSLVLFWIDACKNSNENSKVVSELKHIEQSLSTRYIGIFPDYLEEINEILETTDTVEKHPIVIFEDVLYYGLFYNSSEFKKMINNIQKLSDGGHKITIAHYNIERRMFREVVQESRIDKKYLDNLKIETIETFKDMRRKNPGTDGIILMNQADSIISQKYFDATRSDNISDFKESVDFFRTKLYAEGDDRLFAVIDSIRTISLSKDYEDITFADFFEMYKNITIAISQRLANTSNGNVELIKLNDYLVMSCWSNSKTVLFALPGKFAADEIGFISRDQAINNYINTQLSGIRYTR